MNGRYVVATLLVIGSIGAVGVGSAVAGVGPAAELLDDDRHTLLDFEATDPECTEEQRTNSSTSIENDARNTIITHAQNVSLPDPSHSVGDPTFEHVNESTYVLSVPTERTEEAAALCLASARYEASMEIPVGDEPWTVIVEHDGETATTLAGDSNSTSASGSASAGVQVSD